MVGIYAAVLAGFILLVSAALIAASRLPVLPHRTLQDARRRRERRGRRAAVLAPRRR